MLGHSSVWAWRSGVHHEWESGKLEHQNLSYAAMGYVVNHLGPASLMNLFFHLACNLHHSKIFVHLSHIARTHYY